MADNVGFIRSLYDAWNVRDLDAQADATAPDGVITVVGTGDVFEGPEGTRKYAQSWVSGFPDGQVTVDNILADGDRVVVESRTRAASLAGTSTTCSSASSSRRA